MHRYRHIAETYRPFARRSLPTRVELTAYKAKLKALRGLPDVVRRTLELLPAATYPTDVMRSGVWALGCVLPEAPDHKRCFSPQERVRLFAVLTTAVT